MSAAQKAAIGRIVHVLVDPIQNNGSDIAAAVIVRSWGEPYEHDGYERQTVNVRVLGDSAETLWLTSIALYNERPAAEHLEKNSHNPKGYRSVAFWPPRV